MIELLRTDSDVIEILDLRIPKTLKQISYIFDASSNGRHNRLTYECPCP